ncbi:MAG: 3D domain-containing protein [Bacillota bacterium]
MKTYLRSFAIASAITMIGCVSVYASNVSDTKAVTVYLDDVPWLVSTQAETVGELLEEIDSTIVLDYYMSNQTKKTDSIQEMMEVQLISMTEKTTSSIIEIPFETIERENPDLPIGTTNVVQKGVAGKITKLERQVFHGKELEYNQVVSEQVLQKAVDEIIEHGTQDVVEGYNFTNSMQMKVTAYTPFDPGCTGITATGTVARHGVIAVDPTVIPLGTKVYIPGYGLAIAEDTGGAIKNNRLDVCFSSREDALEWGVRSVTVYIISDDDMMDALVSNGLQNNGLMEDESILEDLLIEEPSEAVVEASNIVTDPVADTDTNTDTDEFLLGDFIPVEDELKDLFL